MDKFSFIANADVGHIEDLYKSYQQDPASVDETWHKFFQGFEFSQSHYGENGASTEIGSDEIKVRN